jgi:hypothetical protein
MMHESSHWHETMTEMQSLARILPEEDPLWAAALARALVDLVTDLEATLTTRQRLLLVAIGSIFARQAANETMAALEASVIIDRARKRNE